MTDDCLPLPALTLGQIAELFPDVHYVTVSRWSMETNPAKTRLPDPAYLPAGNKKRALWDVETVLVWASDRGMSWDQEALRRICQTDQL